MTVLTCDTGLKGAECQQLSILDRARGVAAKASYGFVRWKPSPHRFVKTFRSNLRIADRDSESANGRVVANEAFVVDAVALKHPGLRAIAKTPADRESYGLGSVGHGAGALAILGLYNVGVAKFMKRDSWMGIQNGVGARQLECVSSGCVCVWEEWQGTQATAGSCACFCPANAVFAANKKAIVAVNRTSPPIPSRRRIGQSTN